MKFQVFISQVLQEVFILYGEPQHHYIHQDISLKRKSEERFAFLILQRFFGGFRYHQSHQFLRIRFQVN